MKRGSYKKTYISTLCWDCGKAHTYGCSWSRDFEPVKGWEAIENSMYNVDKGVLKKVESYIVLQCPEYTKG